VTELLRAMTFFAQKKKDQCNHPEPILHSLKSFGDSTGKCASQKGQGLT